MEGMIGTLFRQLELAPMIIIIAVILFYTMKDLKANIQSMSSHLEDTKVSVQKDMGALRTSFEKDIEELKADFKAQLEGLQELSNARDERIESELKEHHNRLLAMEKEHMSKEDIYRLIGGWKHDLELLAKSIDKLGDRIHGK